MQYMKARQIIRNKEVREDGTIIEMVVWQLSAKTPERPHGVKYRLYCGHKGVTLVRYDNEQGKGDHRHYGEKEESYRFESLERLIRDFLNDVERLT